MKSVGSEVCELGFEYCFHLLLCETGKLLNCGCSFLCNIWTLIVVSGVLVISSEVISAKCLAFRALVDPMMKLQGKDEATDNTNHAGQH